jgi:hypothetical protein
MEKILNILYDITTYAWMIPILLGIYTWRFLSCPLKVWLISMIINQIITVFASILSHQHRNTNILYYLLCLNLVFAYSFFFRYLTKFKYSKIIFLVIPLAYLLYFGIDFLINGIRDYFVILFLVIDILMLPFAINLFRKHPNSTPIRIINISFIINFIFDLAFSTITSNLFNYFDNKVFSVFFSISPIFNLTIIALQTYAYYLTSKQTQPSFDNNPNFR